MAATHPGFGSESSARGELHVRIAKKTHILRFRISEVARLQRMLGEDPLAYLARTGAHENFVAHAIVAGLSRDKKSKVHLGLAERWLDDESEAISIEGTEVTMEELSVEILYTIGRGKRGEEAERFVDALNEAFGSEDSAGKSPGAPSPSASKPTPNTTS